MKYIKLFENFEQAEGTGEETEKFKKVFN